MKQAALYPQLASSSGISAGINRDLSIFTIISTAVLLMGDALILRMRHATQKQRAVVLKRRTCA